MRVRLDRDEAIRALRRGLDLGMTPVDTAELYGSGEVERLVGEAIAGRREQVFLVSKVVPEHASYQGTLRACEQSLRRLRTDRIGCYLLHWPGRHPLADTIRAFEHLKEQGKIRSWGVSNFDVAELDEALSLAGAASIACNQVLYPLDERAIEAAVLPWCARHSVALVAYSPFGAGRFPPANSPRGRVLAEIARERGATPHQARARLPRARLPWVCHSESGADAPRRGRLWRGSLVLTADELRRIDEAFPRPKGTGRRPVL